MIGAVPGVSIDAVHERLLRLVQQADVLPPTHQVFVRKVLETCSLAFEEQQMASEELRVQEEELLSTRADLEAERRRYLDLFEETPYGYLVTNVGGLIRDANGAAVEMLALPKRELVGSPLILYVDAGDRELFHAHLDDLAVQGRALSGGSEWEMRLRPRRQPAFPAAWSVVPVSDPAGSLASLRWQVRDLRAIRQTEERERLPAEAGRDQPAICDLAGSLAHEQAILKTIMEHTHAGLAYFDDECQLLRSNESCIRLLEGIDEELIACNPLDLLPGGGRAVCRRVIASGQPICCQGDTLALPNQAGDRVRYLDWALVPVVNGNGRGQGAVLSLVDVTEREQTKTRLQRVVEDLRKSNELLGQFATMVSHDLTTPLQSVLGYLELLEEQDRSGWSQTSNEFVEAARRNAHRMQLMISGLLDRARASDRSRALAPVDLARVLDRVLDRLQLEIERSGATVTHDPLPTVRGDELLLSQIFQNLIANALKFRGDEPPLIHVSARNGSRSPNGNGGGEEWVLAVQDNGIGFDPEEAERLFEPFERLPTERQVPGTGLGLTICSRIVERHGGRIWYESQPGDGATFYVSLSA
jgi:PAS domain S-box-containing protein